MPTEMNPIETKEIRGLNLKLLVTLIICTATTVGTVASTYFSLIRKIDKIESQRTSDDRFNDLRLKTMEANIQVIQTQVESLKEDVKLNRQISEQFLGTKKPGQ